MDKKQEYLDWAAQHQDYYEILVPDYRILVDSSEAGKLRAQYNAGAEELTCLDIVGSDCYIPRSMYRGMWRSNPDTRNKTDALAELEKEERVFHEKKPWEPGDG